MKGALFISLLLFWVSLIWARPMQLSHEDDPSSNVVDVMEFGAVADGKTDNFQAFSTAWAKACASTSPSSLVVPPNKLFLLSPVNFTGPCKSPSINVKILGNISAPNEVSMWKGLNVDRWIVFDSIKGLTITGTGQIDGQGSVWWQCRLEKTCLQAPKALYINHCDDFQMNELKIINSGEMHIVIDNSVGVQISSMTITAPDNSPNTDGIHLQGSKQIQILNTVIGTGDDCISIGTNTFNVNITGIVCGPGHGISVGSLGDQGPAAVENIFVSNCTFHNTMNGVRIKTWQGGSGFCKGVTFKDLIMDSSDNPIIIDQYYCGDFNNCTSETSAVKVSDISFMDIRGTLIPRTAINLSCSKSVSCANIRVEMFI
ncbi:hypothetical protein ACHQM5_004801 [Ranunculus cassubicifolius]